MWIDDDLTTLNITDQLLAGNHYLKISYLVARPPLGGPTSPTLKSFWKHIGGF